MPIQLTEADRRGFEDNGEFIQGVTFGHLHKTIHASFSPLVRWEIGRRLRPNGPLSLDHLTEGFLSRWEGHDNPRKICQDIHELASRVAVGEKPALPNPVALESGFWDRLSAAGGEENATAAGNLSFQMVIEQRHSDRPQFKLAMAPPVLENSRKLWRMKPSDRLLRVKVEQTLLWKLQDPILYQAEEGSDVVLKGRLEKAKQLSKQFKKIFYKPMHVLDGAYRLWYGKTGSRSLLFWSERSLHDLYDAVTVPEFLDTFIPFADGKNTSLSLAKFAARIALFDSQTIPVTLPQAVLWVPDLTNHTLPILPREMCELARQMNLPFTPSCIVGTIDGKLQIWSSYHGSESLRLSPTKERIAFFEDTVLASKAAAGKRKWTGCSVTFSIRLGVAQEERKCTRVYKPAEFLKRPRPAYEEEVMSDGNGLLSWKFAQRIHETLGLKGEGISTAYQARVGGCKGLWTLPADFDETGTDGEWIELRASQQKCDVVHDAFIFDVVRRSTASSGGSIGPQALAVLMQVNESQECKAAIEEALQTLREAAGVQAEQAFLDEEDPATLLSALEKSCQNSSEPAIGALRGNHHRDSEAECVEVYENDHKQYDRHPLSGRPAQWEAQVKGLIQSGFPIQESFIQGGLKRIKENLTKQTVEAKCPIPRSRHAFAIVDHTGTLQPNQIFYQSSAPIKDPYTDRVMRSVITGKVLLNRSPTTQATDWQLCHAVDRLELSNLFDVVVCSAKGSIPFMSKLSGGDYDGDMVDIIWEPRLTENWVNAPNELLKLPFLMSEYFADQAVDVGGVQVNTVAQLQEAVKRPGTDMTRALQDSLLMPYLLPTSFGRLSGLHDELLVQRGLQDPVSVATGYLYTSALDAAKQGLRFRYGHLDSFSLQNLIRTRCSGYKEGKRPQAKEDVPRTESHASNPLTPVLPTRSAAIEEGKTKGSCSQEVSKTASGSSHSSDSRVSPEVQQQRTLSDDCQKPIKDRDLIEAWRAACGLTLVYAKKDGTILQRVRFFAKQQFDKYRRLRIDITDSRNLPKDEAKMVQGKLSNTFLAEFWSEACENFAQGRYRYASPYHTWRHLLMSCAYEVASNAARSYYSLASTCNDFVLFIGYKYICDLKAIVTSRQAESLQGFKDILGPTMLNYTILNSKKQVRKIGSAEVKRSTSPQGPPQEKSPKRPSSEPDSTTPPKRAKDLHHAWTPSKQQGRRMNLEISPESPCVSPELLVQLSESKEVNFFDELHDQLDPEEEEALEEIEELMRYRDADWSNDSGIGSSQDVDRRGVSPESPCRGRKKSTK